MDATCWTREAESAQAGGGHTERLCRSINVSELLLVSAPARTGWSQLDDASEVSWLGVRQTSAARGGLSAPGREGVHWVSGEGTACPVAALGNSTPRGCSGPPRQLWWRESEEISGSIPAPFPDHGERKVSVLDTDYSSYMIFCMEGPMPTDEGSVMCQCLGTWRPCRACPEELRLTEKGPLVEL